MANNNEVIRGADIAGLNEFLKDYFIELSTINSISKTISIGNHSVYLNYASTITRFPANNFLLAIETWNNRKSSYESAGILGIFDIP